MGQAAEDQLKPTNPLRLDRCPDCGYLLTGLPERGGGPECGQQYDSSTAIVLYGYIQGRKGQFPAANAWVEVGLTATVMLLLGAVVAHVPLALPRWVLEWLAWGLATGIGGLYVATYHRRRMRIDDLPDPVQLRLSAAGFGYRVGYGPCRMDPWEPHMTLAVGQRSRGLIERWTGPLSPYTHQMEIAGRPSNSRRTRQYVQILLTTTDERARRIAERVEQWQRQAAGFVAPQRMPVLP